METIDETSARQRHDSLILALQRIAHALEQAEKARERRHRELMAALEIKMESLEVVVLDVGASETGIHGAIDVVLSIGTPIGAAGAVTVAPDPVNGGYAPVGDSPDCWIASGLLDRIELAVPVVGRRMVFDKMAHAATYAADVL